MALLFLHRRVSSTIVITTSKQITDNYRGVHNIFYFIASQDMIRVNVSGSIGAWETARGEIEWPPIVLFISIFMCV